ncbi:MAG: histidine kinase [Bacteroidota bacterium]
MAVALPVPRPQAPARPNARSLALLGLWLVPAAVALGQIYIEQTLAGQAVNWSVALWTTVPNWALWALMTPAVAWLALRMAPGRAPVWQIGVAHAAGGALALGFHAVGNVAAFQLAGLPAEWTLTDVQTHYTLRAHVNAVAYALVVAATWAWAASRTRRQREVREAALRASLAEAELESLRMQLRPHFLFNALHAVGATVRNGDDERAVSMLSSLGDLLRLSLESDGTNEVPLRRELDILDRYLALEKVRFADRLSVEVDASEEARRARVPAWVLQPLVENALKHGIAPKPGPATVRVSAQREDDDLVLSVVDDGVGMNGTRIGSTRRGVPSTGVGLANTRARLDALYDGAATLTLAPGPDGLGAEARLTLPYRPA